MHSWGNYEQKDTKMLQTNYDFLGAWSKSRLLCMIPAHRTTKEWADHVSYASCPTH